MGHSGLTANTGRRPAADAQLYCLGQDFLCVCVCLSVCFKEKYLLFTPLKQSRKNDIHRVYLKGGQDVLSQAQHCAQSAASCGWKVPRARSGDWRCLGKGWARRWPHKSPRTEGTESLRNPEGSAGGGGRGCYTILALICHLGQLA